VNGKSAWLHFALIVLFGYALSRVSNTDFVLDAICVGGVSLISFIVVREVRKMREYAVANPHLALMEGADVTAHLKFVAESKALPLGDLTAKIPDPRMILIEDSTSAPPEEENG
jgi:hypothetical protein